MGCLARVICAIAITLGLPLSVAAQGVWTLSAPANPKHDVSEHGGSAVDHYELVVQLQTGTVQTPFNLGKPAIVPTCVIGAVAVQSCIQKDVDAYIKTLPAGTHRAQLVAVSSAGVREVSAFSDPFPLVVPVPGPQGAPGVLRSGPGL
jgi:hypothetical protein